ncbi:hemagglutinin repeat-containing protein [Lysobacter sp. A378]
MNKNLYRIVFNRALGVLQVVGEIARGASSGGSSAGGRVSATLRPLGFAMWLSLGWVGVVVPTVAQEVQGQRHGRIVSDPNAPGQHRPTVLETPDGVPLVNITTPSAAGVSRNVYSQFDVDARGVILNNARSRAQTQLAGWVEGNPWLATGTARVILNEVNSANPSYLNGYVEVAGARAQVVIANPAGIQVDGGGFLNANRVTLTTGSPIIEQGDLAGYRVERGTIRVTGAGLDATHTDYTDVISRSVEVNAGIWAHQLQVTTGVNDVTADHAGVVTRSAAGGNPPALALDVSALGGMYAGKISLLGTEHGLGVRNAGGIGASAGELTVTVDGRLENSGELQSKTDTRVDASGGVGNTGTLSATRELSVTTPESVDNSGTLNAERIEVSAGSLRNRGGAIEQTGLQQLTLQADYVTNREGGRIGVMASTGSNAGSGDAGGGTGDGPGADEGDGKNDNSGGVTPPTPGVTPPVLLADGVLAIGGVLDNDGGRINAGGGVELLTATGLDNSGGHLGLRDLLLEQGELGNAGGQITVSRDARLHLDSIDNDGGLVEVAGLLDIEVGALSNRSGTLTHSGQDAAAVRVSGTLDNTVGTLTSNAGYLSIGAGIVVNEAGRLEHAGSGGLQLTADTFRGSDGVVVTAGAAHVELGQADHRGATLSAAQLTLQAGAFDNAGGQVVATGPAANSVSVQGSFDNGDGGRIASSGDLQIQAATFGNEGGTVQHAGTGALGIDADTLDGAGGTIASNGRLALSGEQIDLRGGATTADQIAVQAGDLTTAGGTFAATGEERLQLQVRGVLDNSDGTLATNGGLEMVAGEVRNRDGQIQAAGADTTWLRISGTFDNAGGIFAAAGHTDVEASNLLNAAGSVQVAGDSTLRISTAGLLDNSQQGVIHAGGDITLTADILDNTDGRIEHAGEGTLAIAADRLDGEGGAIAGNGALRLTGETTHLQGATTHARSIAMDTGSLSTADGTLIASGSGPLQLRVRETLDNDRGTIATNGALDVSAGVIGNQDGAIQSAAAEASHVQASGLLDNRGGLLATAGDATISARSLLNSGGAVQTADSSDLDIQVADLLNNSDAGLIAAGGDIRLDGGTIDNASGRIEHAGEGTLRLAAEAINGVAGTIISNGSLDLTAGAADLSNAETVAQKISIAAGSLSTAGGTLIASGNETLDIRVDGSFDNSGGQVATNGGLVLSAGSALNREGLIQSAGANKAVAVEVTGSLDNTGGTLAAAGDTTLVAGELLNSDGTVQAAGDSSLKLSIDGLLDNSEGLLAAGGDTTLSAGTLDNAAGSIEHAGQGALSIHAHTLNGAEGLIASNGALAISGETTVLRGAVTQAQAIAVDTGTLVTADGSLVAGSDSVMQLQVRDTLDNDGGTVATNGALRLAAGTLGNRGGTIQAAGPGATGLHVAGAFDNTGGTLASAGNTTINAGTLVNAGGSVQTIDDSTLAITVEGLLDNSEDGLLASGGDTVLQADTLNNTAGRIEHAGSGSLDIDAATLDGANGTIASNGALSLTGDTTRLQGGSTSAQSITVDTGALTTAGGLLVASGDGPLRLRARDSFDNDGGTVATNGSLDLTAGDFSNRDGIVQAAGTSTSTVRVDGGFDNTGGTLVAAGDTTVVASELLNIGGTLQAADASQLDVSVDGLLDNSSEGRIVAGGDMTLAADVLDNTAGSIEHAGDGELVVAATTLDGAGGTIASNGALSLTGDDTNLRGGITHAESIWVDTGLLTTADGSFVASGDGPMRLRLRDGLDNDRGMLATNGTLDLLAGAISNSSGVIQSAGTGPSRVQVTGRFDNDGGTLATAGDATVSAAALDNTDGTVQTVGDADLQVSVDGLLDNSNDGLLASGGDMEIAAATLDNSVGRIEHAGDGALLIDVQALDGAGGTIISNAFLELSGDTLDLGGGETIARRIAVDANTLVTAGGTLIASGDDALELTVRDTFDNTAGTIATNGGLQLAAGSALNRDGTIQALGDDTTGIRVHGSFDNTAGTITTTGTTTLHAGALINTDGVLQAASDTLLQVTTDGQLLNNGGAIQGNGDIALQARTLDNRDGTIATQQSIDAVLTEALDNSGGRLVAGGDLTVAAGALINRDTLDGTGERGLFGDNVTLDAASIDNTRGRIGASESLTVDTGELVNAAGAIDGEGEVVVTAATFDNTGGTLVQRGAGDLLVDVSGAISNSNDGLIGTEGGAILRAGTLDNTGGTVFAREGLDITSNGQLLNRNGGLLQSNAGMSVTAGGAFDNSGGLLDATAAATVAASRITNIGGQMLAGQQGNTGAGLTLVSTGSLDNRGGTVGSRGGDLQLDVTSVNNRDGGALVAGRDMALNTNAVDNTDGTVYATRNLRYENSSGVLDNAGGQFGAGDTAWLDLADIGNTNGGRIQAGTLWLTADTMDNQGGEAGADILHAQVASFTGSGRLYGAQWLDLVFSGDYTYGAGEQLESGDRLDLTVAGTFTNQGTLESAGTLNLTAGNVVNQGTINASNASGTGLNSISASGTIDNHTGASIEGDTVELVAGRVTNTGDIIGDVVAIEADQLTNGRDLGTAMAARDYGEGFIGAADYLQLLIGQRLSNLDGELFSGGDLVIAGRDDGTRTDLLENVSGRIQAEGDVFIAADRIDNVRRVLDYEQRALTPAEQEAMTQVIGRGTGADSYGDSYQQLHEQYCAEDFNSHCTEFRILDYTEIGTPTEGLFVTRASAASMLASGGDMTLETTTLRNRHSAVAAGEDLLINGGGQSGGDGENAPGVLNESLSGEQNWDVTADYYLLYQRCRKDLDCQYEPRDVTGTLDFGQVTRMVTPEQGRATITAGNSLTIISGGDVSNAVVNASDGLDGIGPGTVAGPGTRGLGSAGQASAGSVGTAGPVAGGSANSGSIADAQTDGVTSTSAPGAVDRGLVDGRGDVHGVNAGTVSPTGSVTAAEGTRSKAPAETLDAAGEWVNGSGNPLNAAPQLVGTPDRPLPGLVPPDNGMFDQAIDPNAPFLVTTAPRFVPGDTIGSDYLAGLLGGGTDLHKRLGDNYYEQRMVLEQILQLTGRRTLDGSDGLAQYRTLMDNAADTASQLGLALGAPLTAMQIAALDRDIVWLVEQVVDGQKVLVPVVYLSRATAERLRADGALIAAADVGIHSGATVRNDGTVSATQGMWLSADTLINDGMLDAGQRLAISATGDVRNRGALVSREGDAVVQAGRDFVQTATGSLVAGGSAVVDAGRDLRLQATTVSAGDDLALTAGRDLSVAADTTMRTIVDGRTVYGRETLQATDLQAGGNLVLQADRDVTLQAAQLQAGEAVAIAAGRDLELSTVTTTNTSLEQINGRRFKQRTETLDETVHGTTVQAGGNIAMTASRDATLTAAQVVSDAGGIAIAAGRDLTLAAAEETHRFEQDTVRKKSGFLSSKTTTTHDETTATYAVGTTLSGETVDLAAGRDFSAIAAQVVGTGDVAIAAGRDLTLDAGQSTYSEAHEKHEKKSGLMSGMGSGIGITIGSRHQGHTMDATQTTAEGSVVGSIEGNVSLVAGRDLTVRGSDVLSATGTQMIGENVTITAAEEAYDRTDGSYFKQSGLNVAVGGGVVDAALGAYGAAKRGSEVEDDRLAALYAVQSGYAGYDTYQGMQGMESGTSSAAGGVNVRITVGSQMSESQGHLQETTHRGSTIRSGGDIAIVATGDGEGNGGDLNIVGSSVDGQNVALAAANDLTIRSSQDAYSSESSNRSQGGEIGVAISANQSGGAAAGLYVAANAARGEGDGEGVVHQEGQIRARDTLAFTSGNDTTVQGGQLSAEQVTGRVGGDLRLISEQDTDGYDRRDRSAQGSMTIGYGFEGQASASYGRIESDYASVTEQTGIQAGNGGFDIEVGGHTELVGAAIASTADSDKNRLSTETLAVSDLHNRTDYSALSVSVSTSGDNQGGTAPMSGGFSPGMGVRQDEDASSVTSSAISEGAIEIRSGDETALASIDRSATELQQSGLGEIFDEQQVKEKLEMGQVAGEVGMRTAGRLAQEMGWEEGSKEKAVLHGLVGAGIAALGGGDALQGLTGAAASQLVTRAMQEYLGKLKIDPDSGLGKSLMELGSLAVGTAFGGGSGAATALYGEQFNRQLHPEETANIKSELAEKFMAECGCSYEEAVDRLIRQAAQDVDLLYDMKLGETDDVAQAFLADHSFTFTDEYGHEVKAFDANVLDRATAAKYSELYLKPENRESLLSIARSIVPGIQYRDLDTAIFAYVKEKLGGGVEASQWLAEHPGEVAALLLQLGNEVASFDPTAWLAEAGEGTVAYSKAELERCKALGSACAMPSEAMLGVLSVLYGNGGDVSKTGHQIDTAAQLSALILLGDLNPGKGAASKVGKEIAGEIAEQAGKQADSVVKAVDRGQELAKRADVDQVRQATTGSKGNWDKTVNGQLEPKTAYVLDNGHAYVTDTTGRVKSLDGELSLTTMDRNTYQQCATGKCGDVGDEGGHLIASSLGGAGDRINIVPQASTLNRGDWKRMESELRQALKDGKSVHVKIDLDYPSNGGKRPNAFYVEAIVDGQKKEWEFWQ